MISFLKRLFGQPAPRRAAVTGKTARIAAKPDPAGAARQKIIAEIQELYRKAVGAETALAHGHKSNPHFTAADGHNVGHDEMVAVIYAARIGLTPSAAELGDPAAYANRLVADLEAIKADYRRSERDPDGYGIGTLHSLSKVLEPFTRPR